MFFIIFSLLSDCTTKLCFCCFLTQNYLDGFERKCEKAPSLIWRKHSYFHLLCAFLFNFGTLHSFIQYFRNFWKKSKNLCFLVPKSCVLQCKICVCATLLRPKLVKLYKFNFVCSFLQVSHNFFFKKKSLCTIENSWQSNDRTLLGRKKWLRAIKMYGHFRLRFWTTFLEKSSCLY